MEKNSNKNKMEFMTIKLHNDINYDPNYQFVKGKNDWINYGQDNNLPNELIKFSENSPTHQSLLFLKKSMTFGGGLDYDINNELLHYYITSTDLNNSIKKCVKDLILFNGFSFDIGWNSNGDFISEIGHYDFSQIRAQNNPESNKVDWYYLCSDWSKYKQNEIYKLPKFNIDKSKSQPNQILYKYEYTPGTYFYPKPDYKCFKFIQFEIKLADFVLANIENGMSPSGIFSFKEIPTAEERQIIKQNIKRDFTGPQSSGKFIALFAESKDKAVEFIPIKSDNNADIYKELNNLCIQKIISGHHLNNPSVAGLPSTGGLSFGNELATSYEYFYNIVIKQYQQTILDELSKLLIFNKLIKNKEEISFKELQPYQYKFDSNIIGNSVQVNEIRKSMGLPSIEGGDVILFKNGQNPIPNSVTVNNPNQQLPPTTNQAPTL